MGLVVDTSVLIDLERGRVSRARLSKLDEPLHLAAISASELLHGVHRATPASVRARRERFVEGLLGLVPVLPFTLAVARFHARIWAELAARGKVIGAHDLQIAATALAHDHGVLTANPREFKRVAGLRVVGARGR